MGWEETQIKGWGLKAMMSEVTQIFIDLSGLKVGWGETCLKGWGLRAIMSELAQIFYRLRFFKLIDPEKETSLVTCMNNN